MTIVTYLHEVEKKPQRSPEEEALIFLGSALEEVVEQLALEKHKTFNLRFLTYWCKELLHEEVPV